MEKALEMGKTSAKGSLKLLIGVAGSTVIMAAGTIVLTRLMSPAEYGLYGVTLTPALMITLFRDWGISSALTKNIATLKASGRTSETRTIVMTGLAFEAIVGLLLSLLSLSLASYIASEVFHRPETMLLISIVSVTIISGSMLAVAQSVFVGFERMGLNSLTVICQAIVKSAAGPALVVIGYGVLGATLGYALSFVGAGIIGLALMYVSVFRPLKKSGENKSNKRETIKSMLKYGVPLSIYSIISGVLIQFYAFMMAAYIGDIAIGNYHAAVNFGTLLTFLTIPIGTVLFPAFAKVNTANEPELLRTVFASSTKYSTILLAPATMAMMVLSGPMVNTLFGERYTAAPLFLSIYVISNLLAGVGGLSVGSFLTGVGETRTLMKQSLVTLFIGIPLGFLLIPALGVTGMIVASVIAGIPGTSWTLYWSWKHYRVRADLKSSAKILLASSLATVTTFALLNFLAAAEWIRLTTGIAVFIVVYAVTTPITGAIVKNDIDNLRAISSGLGAVSKAAGLALGILEKMLKLRARREKTPNQVDHLGKS